MSDCLTIPWNTACQASLSFTVSWSLLKLMSIASVMLSNHLILSHLLLLLPSVFPSIKVFSNELTVTIGASASVLPMNIQSWFPLGLTGLISCSPKVKNLLQHLDLKASVLRRRSSFFMVQLSHPYMATGRTIALTVRTFISKVMSLLFNMLSRLVITCLPRSKLLLISWL